MIDLTNDGGQLPEDIIEMSVRESPDAELLAVTVLGGDTYFFKKEEGPSLQPTEPPAGDINDWLVCGPAVSAFVATLASPHIAKSLGRTKLSLKLVGRPALAAALMAKALLAEDPDQENALLNKLQDFVMEDDDTPCDCPACSLRRRDEAMKQAAPLN